MTARQQRRLARVLLLRSLRLVRCHHFSMISAAILVTALTVALTSSGFEIADGPEPRPAAAAANPGIGPTAGPMPAGGSMAQARWLVYYIVESEEQIDELKAAIRSDAIYLIQQGLPPLPLTWVYYLLFDSPEEEAHGARFLNQVIESAPSEGYNVKIVDLTR